MAERRERERRRQPTQRQYRFATPPDGSIDSAAEIDSESAGQVAAKPKQVARTFERTAAPAAYADDYGYVAADLRRVFVVVGLLLVVLLALAWFTQR